MSWKYALAYALRSHELTGVKRFVEGYVSAWDGTWRYRVILPSERGTWGRKMKRP